MPPGSRSPHRSRCVALPKQSVVTSADSASRPRPMAAMCSLRPKPLRPHHVDCRRTHRSAPFELPKTTPCPPKRDRRSFVAGHPSAPRCPVQTCRKKHRRPAPKRIASIHRTRFPCVPPMTFATIPNRNHGTSAEALAIVLPERPLIGRSQCAVTRWKPSASAEQNFALPKHPRTAAEAAEQVRPKSAQHHRSGCIALPLENP